MSTDLSIEVSYLDCIYSEKLLWNVIQAIGLFAQYSTQMQNNQQYELRFM